MIKVRDKWREGWDNAFYRATMCYIAILVTIIFVSIFFNPSSDDSPCGQGVPSVSTLVPVVGVQFNAES